MKISQSDFTKFIEIESDSENELFELKSTEIIVVDSSKAKKTINKEDIREYLSSSTSFFLKKKNISQVTSSEFQSFFKQLQLLENESETISRTAFTRFHYFRTLFDEENVLLKESTRFRKFNSRRQAYFIALEKTSTNEKQAYYESFVTSLKKKKKFYWDEFSSKSKYYHQMLKHFQASKFLRIINIEIQTL